MELFLSNSSDSFLLELLSSLLDLTQTKSVTPIRLSPTAIKLYDDKSLKLPGLPCLITEQETILTSPASIAIYLVELAYCDDILLGGSKEKAAEILSVFEVIQRKTKEEVLSQYNDHLLTKSFLYGGHLTLGDLALFAYLYSVMFTLSDSDKIKYCNLTRWYLHIQSLENVKAFLKKDSKGIIELPENLEEEKKKKK